MRKTKDLGRTYYAKNKINGKGYVGCTVQTVAHRKRDHIQGNNAADLLHAAIVKFGVENFIFETVFEGPIEDALKKEQHFIKKFKTLTPNGYNQVNSGAVMPMLGKTHTEEVRERLSAAKKGKESTFKGKHHTEEAKASLRAATIEQMSDPDQRAIRSEAMKGKTHAKGAVHSPEARAKSGAAHKGNTYWVGRKHTEESKQKQRDAKVGKKSSPETKAKVSKSLMGNTRSLGYKQSEETKAKVSESLIGNQRALGMRHTSRS